MDTIFIEHLALRGRHGVSDEERTREQEFVVDMTIEYETARAAQTDDLSDTIDYNVFRDVAREVVEKRSFRLLERLAEEIAKEILNERRIGSVAVSVRKTEMFPDCTPGVSIARKR